MSGILSVEKALRLLQALDRHGTWIGVRELSRRLGLTPPTTHNILKTLQNTGFVEFNPDLKQYRLGLAATLLGENFDVQSSIKSFPRPFLERLSGKFGETAVVAAWIAEKAVELDWIHPNTPLAATHREGPIEFPYRWATGRALLAHQPLKIQHQILSQEKYDELGSGHATNVSQALERLERVVKNGYALTQDVAMSGITAVGAPVFDANQRAVMAIGWSAPLSRTSEEKVQDVRHFLVEMTQEMTRILGGMVSN